MSGKKTVEYQGRKISGKRLMAMLLWEIVSTGKATMPNGATLIVSPELWLAVAKMLYAQIDGPPPQSLDVTSQGQRITGFVNVSPEDWEKGDDAK